MARELIVLKSWLKNTQHVNVSEEWLQNSVDDMRRNSAAPRNLSLENIREAVWEKWLHTDLSAIPTSCLPLNLKTKHKETLTGYYALQIDEIVDISQSAYSQFIKITNQENENAKVSAEEITQPNWQPKANRMLWLTITDGKESIFGMEYCTIPEINLGLAPGTKILIHGSLTCRLGVVLLKKENVKVLGGEVDTLKLKNNAAQLIARSLGKEDVLQKLGNNVVVPIGQVGIQSNEERLIRTEPRNTFQSSCKKGSNSNNLIIDLTEFPDDDDIIDLQEIDQLENSAEKDDSVNSKMWPNETEFWTRNSTNPSSSSVHSRSASVSEHRKPLFKNTSTVTSTKSVQSLNSRTNRKPGSLSNSKPLEDQFSTELKDIPSEVWEDFDNDMDDFDVDDFSKTHCFTKKRNSNERLQSSKRTCTDLEGKQKRPLQENFQSNIQKMVDSSKNQLKDGKSDVDEFPMDIDLADDDSWDVCVVDLERNERSNVSTIRQDGFKSAKDLKFSNGFTATSTPKTNFGGIKSIQGGSSMNLEWDRFDAEETLPKQQMGLSLSLQRKNETILQKKKCVEPKFKEPLEVLFDSGDPGVRRVAKGNYVPPISPPSMPFDYLSDIFAIPMLRRRTLYTLRAFISTLTTSLSSTGGTRWTLQAKINDGTASLDVILSNKFLEELIGFKATDLNEMRMKAKTDPSFGRVITNGLQKCQKSLRNFSGFLEVEFLPDAKPVVIRSREITAGDVAVINKFVSDECIKTFKRSMSSSNKLH